METPLNTLLEQFDNGDSSVEGAICRRLAERLLIVPVAEAPDSSSDRIVVHPFIRKLDDESAVVAFTSPRYYREWRELVGARSFSVNVFGSDLAHALSEPCGLLLNEGSATAVMLPLRIMEQVAAAGRENPTAPGRNGHGADGIAKKVITSVEDGERQAGQDESSNGNSLDGRVSAFARVKHSFAEFFRQALDMA